MPILDGLDHEKTVIAIVGKYEDWKLARRQKEIIWQECLSNYLVYVDEAKYENFPWRCKVADTFSQETADTIASALRNAMFPESEDFYELVAMDDLGRKYQAKMKTYFDDLLVQKLKLVDRLNPFFKQMAVLGNAPLMTPWRKDEVAQRRRQREVNAATGERTTTIKRIAKRLYDGPGLDVLDCFDVVFDPSAPSFRNTPKIRRVLLTADQLKAQYGDVNLEALGTTSGKPSEYSDLQKVARARLFGLREPKLDSALQTHEDEEIEVLELVGDLVIEGKPHQEIIAAVANRKTLLQFEENTYWASDGLLLWGTYDQMWFTPYGKGPLEPVRGVQSLIDTFSCQKADILNLIINGAFAYVDDGIIDPDTLFLRPGGAIEVGSLNNIKELHPNQNVALAYQEIEMLRQRGERSTGASRMDMGQAMGGRKTAYEASLIRQGASGRALDVGRHLANDIMEPLLEKYLIDLQQFKWGSGEIEDEALLGDYRVKYLGADTTALRQFEIQQLMMFTDVIGRNPVLAGAIKPPGYIKRVLQILNIKDPDEIVMNDEEFKQAQAKQQAQAQADQQHGPQDARTGMPGMAVPEQPIDMASIMGGQ